jgi:hypothetical protein
MRSVLIIANSKSIFAKELSEVLWEKEKDIELLDFASLHIQNVQNEQSRYEKMFSKFRKIPKLHMLFRLYYLQDYLKNSSYDVINIHYSRWVYIFILKAFAHKKLCISFYGSDFYRTQWWQKSLQRLLYRHADCLSFTNIKTKEAFVDYYQEYEAKCRVARFGLKTLDFIDKNRSLDKHSIRKKLGYSGNKIIITCGYNATSAQQHEKMINVLKNLPTEQKQQIQFIVPLTYGDMLYKERVKTFLAQSDLDHIVLEEYLYDDDNAYVKLASDIMINLLTTDSFSGSMQEFLYAGNEVITGSWLPYDVLDEQGVCYTKIDDFSQLNDAIASCMMNKRQDHLVKNIFIISHLSHWDNVIDTWEEMYESV